MNLRRAHSKLVVAGISVLALMAPACVFAQNLGYFSSAPIDQHPNNIAVPKIVETPTFIIEPAIIPVAPVAPISQMEHQSTQIITNPIQDDVIIQDRPKKRWRFWTWGRKQDDLTPRPRGPMRAIYEDSKTAIVQDIPQSLADHLPWVDSERKNQEFSQVLARVSNDLSRANAADPEWALPAQSEIRALANKLDRLSSPPVVNIDNREIQMAQNPQIQGRAFRPRPIWPGAVQTMEVQNRPVSLTTNGVEESGAPTSGEVIIWQSSPENEEINPAPSQPRRARSSRSRH